MLKNKLKILVVSQYFWPENIRVNHLVEGLIERGHEVTVLTGLPNYPEGKLIEKYKQNPSAFGLYKGATIIRVPMVLRGSGKITLLLNYLSFFMCASTLGAFKLRSYKFDAVFVSVLSPIMAAIPAVVIGRLKSAPVFVWVVDLWPESLSAVIALKNKLLIQGIGKIVSWIYNRTDYILIQSRAFKSNVLKYCTRPIHEERILYFPSWAEDIFTSETIPETSPLLSKDERFFTVLFAGNIGEAQDFPAILNAFEYLKKDQFIRLIIVGEGRKSPWVVEQIEKRELTNVSFLGRHPISEMPSLFFSADALLISLKSNAMFAKTIPGKLQAYLAAGKPILGMIDGETANIITESGAGFASPAGDAHSLVKNINKMSLVNSDDRKSMGESGLAFYQSNFDSELFFNKLERLFRSATQRRL